ncbi:type II pantothenate kinase [Parabacteroides bouchesdurhonensis]|uniref:type II pantothenate kinase n=1 Tax=Parabacteroides bouchesdurhonensis TaxID=1936995 RepID=UPI000C86592F|nr:type II pantothenate kinase [Parabacteroides bouchesdurhonensis]RHJ91140.1 type II pantothenate kinase [Bacteroides sp. AM07-16]
MGIVIGIDVGGSTTKIVGVEEKKIKSPMFVKATDPVTSLFGALGKYIYDNDISLSNIEKVILTGVGSAYIDQSLYGLPTAKADEFIANGLGAQYLSGLHNLLVVSMGTGTSLVKVTDDNVEHIGGLGIGGGTILGLSKLLLKTQDFQQIVSLAEHGSLSNIDLQIKDITRYPLPGLPLDVTASIFGKAGANAPAEDVALGIIHMVLQTIGQCTVFASLNSNIKDFVLIGNLTRLPQCADIFSGLEKMCNVRFLIPEYAEYRTAIGAALAYIHKKIYKEVV